ncbi:hypothetical protein [Rahnella aquatilis]|uniref:hypothetical protein n=1 Tax=Rahnella aquatilis TaxID=34038 RepID=UPI0018CE216D|nr:hypothetical protein [Rahnella aquatilis]
MQFEPLKLYLSAAYCRAKIRLSHLQWRANSLEWFNRVIFPYWEQLALWLKRDGTQEENPDSIFFTTILFLRGLNRLNRSKQLVEVHLLLNRVFIARVARLFD